VRTFGYLLLLEISKIAEIVIAKAFTVNNMLCSTIVLVVQFLLVSFFNGINEFVFVVHPVTP